MPAPSSISAQHCGVPTAEPTPAAALDTAINLAARCGARALAGRARAELGAAGGRSSDPFGIPVEQLTASELRVAELAARGAQQPGHCPDAVRDAKDRRDPSRPRLLQAGDLRAQRARRRPGRAGGTTRSAGVSDGEVVTAR